MLAVNGVLAARLRIELPLTITHQATWISPKDVTAVLQVAEREVQSSPAECLGGLRILVADDADANRRLISLILTRAGAQVTTAVDGSEAVKLLAANAFDLAIIDMQMPELDGYEATGIVRSQGQRLPSSRSRAMR